MNMSYETKTIIVGKCYEWKAEKWRAALDVATAAADYAKCHELRAKAFECTVRAAQAEFYRDADGQLRRLELAPAQ